MKVLKETKFTENALTFNSKPMNMGNLCSPTLVCLKGMLQHLSILVWSESIQTLWLTLLSSPEPSDIAA